MYYGGTVRRARDQYRALDFCKRNFSEEYSRKVVSQYKKIIGITLLGTVIFGIVFTIVLLTSPLFEHDFSYRRYGHYDNGRIRYVQNDVKYIDMEDWGLDPSGFGPGDDFIMLFDSHDNLREVISKEEYDKGAIIFIIETGVCIVGFVMICLIWAFAARKIFPEFRRYFRWWHTIGPDLCYHCGRRCSTPEQCIQGNTMI